MQTWNLLLCSLLIHTPPSSFSSSYCKQQNHSKSRVLFFLFILSLLLGPYNFCLFPHGGSNRSEQCNGGRGNAVVWFVFNFLCFWRFGFGFGVLRAVARVCGPTDFTAEEREFGSVSSTGPLGASLWFSSLGLWSPTSPLLSRCWCQAPCESLSTMLSVFGFWWNLMPFLFLLSGSSSFLGFFLHTGWDWYRRCVCAGFTCSWKWGGLCCGFDSLVGLWENAWKQIFFLFVEIPYDVTNFCDFGS